VSDALDPVIHAPTRLRIVAALATLADGDSLSFSRLQHLLDLTPGNLITHLRRLEDAGYVQTAKSGARTSVHLTHAGRAAFERYSITLRQLLGPA
jgi:DNA-binding MarR family transcriptional regulator